MHSTPDREILHGYSVVRVSLDDDGDHTVPVGVVAWDTGNAWYRWRWLEKDERVRGVDRHQPPADADRQEPDPALGGRPESTNTSLRRWNPRRRAFGTPSPRSCPLPCGSTPPRAMAPMDEPEAEIESLFEAVVQPPQSRRARVH